MQPTIFVKGFPSETNQKQLQTFFQTVGRVQSAKIVKNFAFITFQSFQDAQKAVQKFNGEKFPKSDFKLIVQLTKSKAERGTWKNNERNYDRQNGDDPQSRRTTACFLCHKQGHRKFQCPQLQKGERRRQSDQIKRRKYSRSKSRRSRSSSNNSRLKGKRNKKLNNSSTSRSYSKSGSYDSRSISKSSFQSSSSSVQRNKKQKKEKKRKEKQNKLRQKKQKSSKTKSKDKKDKKDKREKKEKRKHEYFSSSESSSRSKLRSDSRDKKFSRSRDQQNKDGKRLSYIQRRRSKSPDSRENHKKESHKRFQGGANERYSNQMRQNKKEYNPRDRSPPGFQERKPTKIDFSTKKDNKTNSINKSRDQRSISRSISPQRKDSPKLNSPKRRKNSSCSND